MGIRQLQKTISLNALQSPTGTPVSVLLPASVVTGSLIVVTVMTYNAVTVAVTDSLGNTYSQAGAYAINGSSAASIWYTAIAAGGACTVTATQSSSAYISVVAVEYSGATSPPIDSSSTGNGASGTTWSSGSVGVSAPGDLVVGVGGAVGAIGRELSPSGSQTMNASSMGGAVGMASLEVIADSAVEMSVDVTGGSQWVFAGASFKASAGGGSGGISAGAYAMALAGGIPG